MSRINTTYEAAIYNWLTSVTSLSVVWAEQDINRPSLPYVTANITNYGQSEGFPAQTSNGNDNFTKHIKKLLTVSVNVYGETSANIIDLISDSVFNDIQISSLKTAGLYFRAIENPIPLAQVVEGLWEQRWQIDIIFAYAKDIVHSPGYIDRVSGEIMEEDFDTNNY